VHELKAFMDGYVQALRRLGTHTGISKISVQTGTSHGGVVLPDGTIAKVQLDLDALKALSRDARAQYGLGGAVQHGASTLPPDAFGNFPKCEAIEIHLALGEVAERIGRERGDRKSTRLNSSHSQISYAVFCLKKKKKIITPSYTPPTSSDSSSYTAPTTPDIYTLSLHDALPI